MHSKIVFLVTFMVAATLDAAVLNSASGVAVDKAAAPISISAPRLKDDVRLAAFPLIHENSTEHNASDSRAKLDVSSLGSPLSSFQKLEVAQQPGHADAVAQKLETQFAQASNASIERHEREILASNSSAHVFGSSSNMSSQSSANASQIEDHSAENKSILHQKLEVPALNSSAEILASLSNISHSSIHKREANESIHLDLANASKIEDHSILRQEREVSALNVSALNSSAEILASLSNISHSSIHKREANESIHFDSFNASQAMEHAADNKSIPREKRETSTAIPQLSITFPPNSSLPKSPIFQKREAEQAPAIIRFDAISALQLNGGAPKIAEVHEVFTQQPLVAAANLLALPQQSQVKIAEVHNVFS